MLCKNAFASEGTERSGIGTFHKADSGSGALDRLSIQSEFFGLRGCQHGDKYVDPFPRQRAYLFAKPIVATRPGDDGDVIGVSGGDGVYGCSQSKDIITVESM